MMSCYYLAATDLDHAISIINKDPKKKIQELMDMPPQGLTSMLIDPVTGDLYDYMHSKRKWVSKLNTGLHYKQMNEVDTIYKNMNFKPLYYAKVVEEDYPLIKGVNVEAIVRIRDVQIQLI